MDRTPGALARLSQEQQRPAGWVVWPEGPNAPPQIKTVHPIVISSGTVCRITDITWVRHRQASIFVHWFGNGVPPAVKLGARIGFLGKLCTYNQGNRFHVREALLLTATPKSILNALMGMLPDIVVNPGDYLTDVEIEEQTQPWE